MELERARDFVKTPLGDAVLAGAIAAVLALPLLGFRLTDAAQGAGIEFRPGYLLATVAIVFLGRLALNYIRTLSLASRPPPALLRAFALRRATSPQGGGKEELSPSGATEPSLDVEAQSHLPQRGEVEAPTRSEALRVGGPPRAALPSAEIETPSNLPLVGRSIPPKRFSAKADRVGGALLDTAGLWALIAFAVALPLLPFAERNVIDTATLILLYVLLATGLNITVGLAGLLDLGYVAFYAVGAYSYALLTTALGFSFWEAMPLAGVFAAAFGLMLGFPVLRLRGDYLAIVTLGFGQIVRVVLINWTEVTGGPNGISGIARPSFFGLPFQPTIEGQTSFADYFGVPFSPLQRIYFLYYLILAVALLAMLFVWRLKRLPLGRAFEALREDETASIALGLNPTIIKLSAFALGAGIAGIAGALFATRQGFISPESFTFVETAIILSIVVLGGMGSQLGIVLAAILLVGLPEWFRELADYRMVAFGAAMVLIMLWRPHGLTRVRRPTLMLKQSAAPRAGAGARA